MDFVLSGTCTLAPDRGLRLIHARVSRVEKPRTRATRRDPPTTRASATLSRMALTTRLDIACVQVRFLSRDAGDKLGPDHAAPMPRGSSNRKPYRDAASVSLTILG